MSAANRRIVVGIGILGALLAYLILDSSGSDPARPNDTAPPDPESPVTAAPAHVGRQAVELPATPDALRPELAGVEAIPAHAQLPRSSVWGRVIDLAGTAVGGVEVWRTRPRGLMPDGSHGAPAGAVWSVVADAAGRFEAEGTAPFLLGVRDDTYATVLEGFVGRSTDAVPAKEVLVVVAPRIALGGVVVDGVGAPLEGVQVTIAANVPLPERDLDSSRLVVPETRSDAQGFFRVEDAAAVPAALLQFQLPGLPTKIVPLPAGGDPAMTVVMSRETENTNQITGRVVLADGSPAMDAFVSTGSMASPTDARGFFVIDLGPWRVEHIDEEAPTVLTAVGPGLLPATKTLPSLRDARSSGWPESIVLRLIGQPLTISGVVVDEHDAPMRGVLVEPTDMTAFGFVRESNMPAFAGVPKTQEQLAGGGAVRTDADGRFVLGGLLARNYTIRALQRPSLLSVESLPVAAGSQNILLVLDGTRLGTIAGRIVDRTGLGIGNVRVAVSCERPSELVIGRRAVTAADGTFSIADVTLEPEFLRIEGDAIVPELFRKLGPNDDPARLELRVAVRRQVQFDWGAQLATGDRLFVVDELDTELMMMRLSGGSIGEAPYLAYSQGVSEVVAASDAAAFAVVRRDGREVARVRLQLAPDAVSLIQL